MFKIFLIWAICSHSLALDVIYVGLYNFPPYAEITDTKAQGAAVDLIHLLNDKLVKSDIELRPYFTSPKRRYQDYEENKFDYIFFESEKWGWEKYNLSVSPIIAMGGEKYLSLKTNKNIYSQKDLQKSLKDKKIAVILGYHYGFAELESNEEELKRKYNIIFTNDHSKNIDLVLKGRADLAIITESYFKMKSDINQDLTSKLKLSTDYDQIYNHKILGRPNSKLSMKKIMEAMNSLKKEGKLKTIEKKYYIDFP